MSSVLCGNNKDKDEKVVEQKEKRVSIDSLEVAVSDKLQAT